MSSTNGSGSNIAEQVVRNDGTITNALTGIGTSRDKNEYTQVGYAPLLSQEQEMQLAQDVFMGRVCSAKPDAATRRWCEIAFSGGNVSDEVVTAFNSYRDTIGGETEDEELISDREIFSWAGYLANIHPGCAIVMDIDDGNPPDQPINPKRIRSIPSVQILDPYKIRPDILGGYNPFQATHYEIILPQYGGDRMVNMFDRVKRDSRGYYTYSIHRSRVLRIPGVRIPPDLMLRNQGWDRSLIAQIWEAFRTWMASYKDVGNLIHDYSLFVYLLKGLRDMVSENQEEALRQRLRTFRESITALGGATLDLEEEKIEFLQRQFGGLDSLMDKFRDFFIGASGIPHTILFGESPSGLGATGESEEKVWADAVEEYQSRVILPRLRRLYRLIWLAKDGPTNGEEPEGWFIKFLPLRQQTEEERLSGLSLFMGALSGAINGGFLLPEEARSSFKGGKATYEIILDEEAWQKKQEQDAGGFDFGGFGSGEPAAPAEPALEESAEPPVNQDSMNDPLWQQALAETRSRFRLDSTQYARLYTQDVYDKLKGKPTHSIAKR